MKEPPWVHVPSSGPPPLVLSGSPAPWPFALSKARGSPYLLPQLPSSSWARLSRRGINYPTPAPQICSCSGSLSRFITMCECYAALENKVVGRAREEERSVFLLVSGDRGPIPQIVGFFLPTGDLSLVAFSAPYRGECGNSSHGNMSNIQGQLGSSWRWLHLPCPLHISS